MAGKTGGVAGVVSRGMRPREIGKAKAVDDGDSHQHEGDGRPSDSDGFSSVVFSGGGFDELHGSGFRGYLI
jgi:hypothetical protein